MLILQEHPSPQTPLVVSCPHAGIEVPASLANSLLITDPLELKRDPDLFVDELYQDAYKLGASFITTSISRYVIDLNRDPNEHDASFVIGGQHSKNPKFLGLVAHKNTLGHALLRAPLTQDQLQARINQYHSPFHAELRRMTSSCVHRFGFCIHIDAHSMPSTATSGHLDTGERAEIVPGDLDGTSCSSKLTDFVCDYFSSRKFSVKCNSPYKGGFITQHFGRPDQNVHTLQIELNRKLYMNELTREKIPDRFSTLQKIVSELLSSLTQLELV